jgi:hypothetical protein
MSGETETITSDKPLSAVELYEEAAKHCNGYFKLAFGDEVLPIVSTEVIPTGPEPAVLQAVNLPEPRFITLQDLGKRHGEPVKREDLEILMNAGSVVAVLIGDRQFGLTMLLFRGFLVLHAPPSSERDWNTFFKANFGPIRANSDYFYLYTTSSGELQMSDITEWTELIELINFEEDAITRDNFEGVVSTLNNTPLFGATEAEINRLAKVVPVLYSEDFGTDSSYDD